MQAHKPLLLLLGTSSFALGDFTQTNAVWTDNFVSNFPLSPISDNNGTALNQTVLQLGYFAGVPLNKSPEDYTPSDWASFVPLSGVGSANYDAFPEDYATVVGDPDPSDNIPIPPGYFDISVPLDTEVHPLVPSTDVRVGMRFFDAATVAGATFVNTVSANDPNWIMAEPAPVLGQTPPFPNFASMDSANDNETLFWEGAPFKTNLVPAVGAPSLVLTSVQQTGPVSLEVSWSGGDGSNDIQTSTNGTDFTTVSAAQASPATIAINPGTTTKLLVRVVEP